MSSSPNSVSQTTHVRRVIDAARFFWEMWEEGTQGDTRAIKCLLPQCKSSQIRQVVLGDLYQRRGLSLSEAALELADWLALNHDAPALDDAMRADLLSLTKNLVKPFEPVQDTEVIIQRSFVRLVRHLQQKRLANEGAHSRCVEFFIAAEHVPIGFGKKGGTYPEHVVPCAFLRDRCLAKLAQNASIEAVAQEIRPFLAVIMITQDEAGYLDKSKAKGGLGLKHKMPVDWNFESGDIFERLHIAQIEFEPPISH